MTDSHARRNGILCIVAAALLWSTGGIGIKAIADPALKVAFYRSLFAAIALFALFGKRVWRRTWRSTPAFAAGLVSYAACLTAFVTATKWTTAANAIFLQYAGVVWVMLLSPLVLREPLRRRDVIAVVTALGGMALFFVGKFDTHGMAGNAMALLSSIFFAGLVLAMRREPDASQAAITWGNVLTALALLPFVSRDLALTPRSALVLIALGVVQIGLAYVLFVRGLKAVSATQASLTGMLEPIANPLWVFLLLGETPSHWAMLGAVIVLCAIGWRTIVGEGGARDLPAVD
jgi:drug/metabolite transporter (DMT)-like permease